MGITLKSTTVWDPDYTDGISAGAKDMVGTMLHEMGHHMGFTSGVDFVPALLPPGPADPPAGFLDDIWTYSVLDLFRYSDTSADLADADVPDVSLPPAGEPPPKLRFLSIDGDSPLFASAFDLGSASVVMAPAFFSTGEGLSGDGEQAGHWKDNVRAPDALFRGLMDPTLADGFPLTSLFLTLAGAGFPSQDLIAFDVIGYSVPEPASLAGLGAGLLLLIRRTSPARRQ